MNRRAVLTRGAGVLLSAFACGCVGSPGSTTRAGENRTERVEGTTTVARRVGAVQLYNFRESRVRGEFVVERRESDIVREDIDLGPDEVRDLGVVFDEFSDYTVTFDVSGGELKSETITYEEDSWEALKVYALAAEIEFAKATP